MERTPSESSGSSCPVLAIWGETESVLKRLHEKDLIILSGGKLNRQTLIPNRDLLIPLINLVGH